MKNPEKQPPNQENKKSKKGIEERIKNLEFELRLIRDNVDSSSISIKKVRNMLEADSPRAKRFKEDIEEIQKTKADILAYTLQVVSIIIGILTVILSISFVIIYKDDLKTYFSWIIVMIAFFLFIFTAWFIVWIKKERVFSYLGDIRINKVTTDQRYSTLITKWLIFSTILIFIYLAIVAILRRLVMIFPDRIQDWDFISISFRIVFIAIIINYIPGLDKAMRDFYGWTWKKSILILSISVIISLVIFYLFKI